MGMHARNWRQERVTAVNAVAVYSPAGNLPQPVPTRGAATVQAWPQRGYQARIIDVALTEQVRVVGIG